MSVPYRITIRLSESDMINMESIMDKYNFESVSEIIRVALREFIEKYLDSGLSKRIEVQLTKRMVNDLNSIIETGEAISIDDLIRSVLKEYTAKKVNSALDHSKGNKEE